MSIFFMTDFQIDLQKNDLISILKCENQKCTLILFGFGFWLESQLGQILLIIIIMIIYM